MDKVSFAQRRDTVLANVLEPLDADGMRKRKGVSVEDHEAFKHDLAERLAWLSVEWHEPLRDTIERNAEKSKSRDKLNPPRNIWPDAVSILNWARGLSQFGDVPKLVGTYMRSRAGREAWAISPFMASALHRQLVNAKRPPGRDGNGWQMLKDQARDAEDQFARDRALIDRGEASDLQIRRVEAWPERKAMLHHLIFGDLDRCPELNP